MAIQLPTSNPVQPTPLNVPQPSADPYAGSKVIQKSLANLGNVGQEIATDLLKTEKEFQTTEFSNRGMSDYIKQSQIKRQELFADSKDGYLPDGVSITDAYEEWDKDFHNTYSEAAPTDDARNTYNEKVKSHSMQAGLDVGVKQYEQIVAGVEVREKETLNNDANHILALSGSDTVKNLREIFHGKMQGFYDLQGDMVSPQKTYQMQRDYGEAVSLAGLENAVINKRPDIIFEVLQGYFTGAEGKKLAMEYGMANVVPHGEREQSEFEEYVPYAKKAAYLKQAFLMMKTKENYDTESTKRAVKKYIESANTGGVDRNAPVWAQERDRLYSEMFKKKADGSPLFKPGYIADSIMEMNASEMVGQTKKSLDLGNRWTYDSIVQKAVLDVPNSVKQLNERFPEVAGEFSRPQRMKFFYDKISQEADKYKNEIITKQDADSAGFILEEAKDPEAISMYNGVLQNTNFGNFRLPDPIILNKYMDHNYTTATSLGMEEGKAMPLPRKFMNQIGDKINFLQDKQGNDKMLFDYMADLKESIVGVNARDSVSNLDHWDKVKKYLISEYKVNPAIFSSSETDPNSTLSREALFAQNKDNIKRSEDFLKGEGSSFKEAYTDTAEIINQDPRVKALRADLQNKFTNKMVSRIIDNASRTYALRKADGKDVSVEDVANEFLASFDVVEKSGSHVTYTPEMKKLIPYKETMEKFFEESADIKQWDVNLNDYSALKEQFVKAGYTNQEDQEAYFKDNYKVVWLNNDEKSVKGYIVKDRGVLGKVHDFFFDEKTPEYVPLLTRDAENGDIKRPLVIPADKIGKKIDEIKDVKNFRSEVKSSFIGTEQKALLELSEAQPGIAAQFEKEGFLDQYKAMQKEHVFGLSEEAAQVQLKQLMEFKNRGVDLKDVSINPRFNFTLNEKGEVNLKLGSSNYPLLYKGKAPFEYDIANYSKQVGVDPDMTRALLALESGAPMAKPKSMDGFMLGANARKTSFRGGKATGMAQITGYAITPYGATSPLIDEIAGRPNAHPVSKASSFKKDFSKVFKNEEDIRWNDSGNIDFAAHAIRNAMEHAEDIFGNNYTSLGDSDKFTIAYGYYNAGRNDLVDSKTPENILSKVKAQTKTNGVYPDNWYGHMATVREAYGHMKTLRNVTATRSPQSVPMELFNVAASENLSGREGLNEEELKIYEQYPEAYKYFEDMIEQKNSLEQMLNNKGR